MKEMSCSAADEDKNDKKNVTSASDEALKEADLEIICNYDSATREIFELILWDRKEALLIKDSYQSVKVDLTKYPQWTDSVVDRLCNTFQVFDASGDGLVDFDEL
jgi:Ca2+-binding EF-hand superfamily protein